MAADAASFNNWIDSTSLKLSRGIPGTPSIIHSGVALFSVPTPRIYIEEPSPGNPLFLDIYTGAFPCKACEASLVDIVCKSRDPKDVMDPDTLAFFCTP